jgi:CheY-like chemotaxis protein
MFTGAESLHDSGTPRTRAPRRPDMTVLIVDDSPKFRELIQTVLAGLVDDVKECADGDEAVAAYRAQRPDWVLMDVQMAGIGGLEATRRILAADRTARVLIVTDYDDAHWRAAAIEAGACGYVLKDNLLDVRRLLETRDGCRSNNEGA